METRHLRLIWKLAGVLLWTRREQQRIRRGFYPQPGDTIYDQNWYCDSEGNLNIDGGYGCDYLEDETHRRNTGAVPRLMVLPAGRPAYIRA